jgi:hypothetical protein
MTHILTWPRPPRITTVPRARFVAGATVVAGLVLATLWLIVDFLSRLP